MLQHTVTQSEYLIKPWKLFAKKQITSDRYCQLYQSTQIGDHMVSTSAPHAIFLSDLCLLRKIRDFLHILKAHTMQQAAQKKEEKSYDREKKKNQIFGKYGIVPPQTLKIIC